MARDKFQAGEMEAIGKWYQDHAGVSPLMAAILAKQDAAAGIHLGQLGYLGEHTITLPPRSTFKFLTPSQLDSLARIAASEGKIANAALLREALQKKLLELNKV